MQLLTRATAACVISGLAYNGREHSKPHRVRWDRVDMVGHWELRTAQNGAVVGRYWNVLGARWVRPLTRFLFCLHSLSASVSLPLSFLSLSLISFSFACY